MASKDRKRLVLLDTHAIIHRAYHALPEFATNAGVPTGALYGLVTMILKIVQDLKPDYVVACYDLPGKTFRHEVYEDYKGKRSETDSALKTQLESSRNVIKSLSIPIYEHPGFEADDMLGTIVEQLKNKKDIEVIIASGDMDTLQLIDSDHVKVYTLKRGLNDTVLYDEQAVTERFGFGPKFINDYKGLRGDTSDNIVGVPGIGEKTATELITNFGSIEDMYKKLKKDPESFAKAGIKPRIVKLLEEHEDEALFSKTLATIRPDAPITFTLPQETFIEGIDMDAFEAMAREFEFRSLPQRLAAVLGKQGRVQETLDLKEKTVDPNEVEKVGIALWLLNSDMTNPNLSDILQYAGTKDFSVAKKRILEELKEKKLDQVYEEIELPIIPAIHAMQERGILLDREYLKKLSGEYHIELDKLQTIIFKEAGREFNINSPKQLGEVLFTDLGLSLKGMKKTAGGAQSTRESELLKLQDVHPIIDHILEYRELQKLLSTYIDPIPEMAGDDGRLHARFLQAGTSTGRFSSQNPNLQNIPIKSKRGSAIRGGFIAAKGHVLAAFDYSQIELRVAALMSKDPILTEIFKEGKDVHASVAAHVFHVAQNEVSHEMRRRAKVINFGIIYGMGVSALQKNLGTSRKEAQDFYNAYFENFKRVEEYLEETKTFAYKNGYTETLFGRRRYFPGLKSPLPFIRAQAERMATNAPIQGTATADIIKLAIKHIYTKLQEQGLLEHVHLLLQIHDELLFEIEEKYKDQAIVLIEQAMEGVLEESFLHIKSDIPLSVNYAAAKSWAGMKG